MLLSHARIPYCSVALHVFVKGQLISKEILVSSILPKNELEIFALAYWGRNFLFVFWENWKNQKALSKLTDL